MREAIVFNHIHDALKQVEEIRHRVLENRQFRGYSAVARVLGGLIAIAAALILSSSWYPQTPQAHALGWCVAGLVACIVNYAALISWYLRQESDTRRLHDLRPALEAAPPLAVAVLLTFGVLQTGAYDILFGVWISMYGLVNISARQSLPKEMAALGWFYITAGAAFFFFLPAQSITDPWPMGIVFLVGELAGGYVLYQHRIAKFWRERALEE